MYLENFEDTKKKKKYNREQFTVFHKVACFLDHMYFFFFLSDGNPIVHYPQLEFYLTNQHLLNEVSSLMLKSNNQPKDASLFFQATVFNHLGR